MVVFPKAKINLGLRITAKRSDGYHNLQTIFYPVSLCDALEFVIPHDSPGSDILTTSGLEVNCSPGDNLIIKVLQKLREVKDVPFLSVHLHKNIPMGAGLGGGSSDAAYFLKALNRYFSLDLSSAELQDISLSIGSDCPFFLECIPSYGEGRGEKLTPVDPLDHSLSVVMINPGINVSTKEAYSGVTPYESKTTPLDFYEKGPENWKGNLVNDFEKTIFEKYPAIGSIKEQLYEMGAIYSSMSGSGSVVYGIFRSIPEIPSGMKKMVLWSGAL